MAEPGSRVDRAEKRVSKLEERSEKITQSTAEREEKCFLNVKEKGPEERLRKGSTQWVRRDNIQRDNVWNF